MTGGSLGLRTLPTQKKGAQEGRGNNEAIVNLFHGRAKSRALVTRLRRLKGRVGKKLSPFPFEKKTTVNPSMQSN